MSLVDGLKSMKGKFARFRRDDSAAVSVDFVVAIPILPPVVLVKQVLAMFRERIHFVV